MSQTLVDNAAQTGAQQTDQNRAKVPIKTGKRKSLFF